MFPRIAWRPILKHVASAHEISIPLHCRGIPGALAVKLLSRALKPTELTRCVTNVQIGKQLQQRPPRACGPVISAVAHAPLSPRSVSTPTEKKHWRQRSVGSRRLDRWLVRNFAGANFWRYTAWRHLLAIYCWLYRYLWRTGHIIMPHTKFYSLFAVLHRNSAVSQMRHNIQIYKYM